MGRVSYLSYLFPLSLSLSHFLGSLPVVLSIHLPRFIPSFPTSTVRLRALHSRCMRMLGQYLLSSDERRKRTYMSYRRLIDLSR